MTHPHLQVATTPEGVRTITLDRPERLNAVNPALADALPRAVDEAARDDAVRVLVLTGAGRGFCAGLDLAEPAMPDVSTRAGRLDPLAWVGRWVLALRACEKPVVAAVNGPAAGAGFGLALAADLRLVADGATMTAGYVRRGLSPDAGVTYFLPRLVGASRAADIVLTGRDVPSEEALRIGLASAVLPAASFAEDVAAYAARLAAGPPLALALTKRLLAQSPDATLDAQLRDELTHIRTCFATKDVAEAMKAFMEKRAPVFRGT
ncbi:enoyl-CoA hydratase-related protein [Roseisolibacter sp. H3M3-2]|uniref:enoyl-CoA hydratase/isomerase family protein n=1 Tax=Roseisolibacter sp. H3M3-2 TaxID=3031323 RepID=UPI0023DBAE8A|nr:enoyl-CoA hydratase-related protein [Roseisolibacter sp. H3M3-2]MDF1501548.1 enoyl-CoA hydratase-related protein [Roseisolibacter sp. H3M3-2]